MAYHNGMYLTTRDSDNDQHGRIHCGIAYPTQPYGGRWHKNYFKVNPNNYFNHKEFGIYLNGQWDKTPPHFIEMKIRPHNCTI